MSLSQEYNFIIVGGGIAAYSCAESLPFWAPDKKILIISASPIIKTVVNPISISKTLVEFNIGQINGPELSLRFPNVDVIVDKVVKINTEGKIVYTEKGSEFIFKKICLCTGGRPKLIFPQNPYVLGIRDTDSVVDFRNRLLNAKRIMIVGNGGIATELVYEIKNVEVIWVIKDHHISSTFIDAGAAEFLKEALLEKDPGGESAVKRVKFVSSGNAALGPDWHSHFEFKGSDKYSVKIEYGATVEEIINLENSIKVILDNKKIFVCDFLVSATGVIPNGDAIKIEPVPFELSEDFGIKVDEFLKTSVEDIYAAGDVVHPNWNWAPQWRPMRLWTQARQMGQYAAKVMGADNEPVIPDFAFELFSHVTRFFGFKVVLLGLFNGQGLEEFELLLRVTNGKEFVKLVLKEGRMQGAVLIGETDLEEMCENLILNQIDLTPFGEDLLNPDIDIDDYFD